MNTFDPRTVVPFVNVKQYIHAVLQENNVYDPELGDDQYFLVMYNAREKLITDWLDTNYGEDIEDYDEFCVPMHEIHDVFNHYMKYVEYLMWNTIANKK
jgi:hypothetical protein